MEEELDIVGTDDNWVYRSRLVAVRDTLGGELVHSATYYDGPQVIVGRRHCHEYVCCSAHAHGRFLRSQSRENLEQSHLFVYRNYQHLGPQRMLRDHWKGVPPKYYCR